MPWWWNGIHAAFRTLSRLAGWEFNSPPRHKEKVKIMVETSLRSYYDQQYFDPQDGLPPKSNYEGYGESRKYYLALVASLAGGFLRERMLLRKKSLVIDVGCAKGYLVRAFNSLPFITAYGVGFFRLCRSQ